MRVFVAGATGVIGRGLVAMLIESGHEVTGMTRSQARANRGASNAESTLELGWPPRYASWRDGFRTAGG